MCALNYSCFLVGVFLLSFIFLFQLKAIHSMPYFGTNVNRKVSMCLCFFRVKIFVTAERNEEAKRVPRMWDRNQNLDHFIIVIVMMSFLKWIKKTRNAFRISCHAIPGNGIACFLRIRWSFHKHSVDCKFVHQYGHTHAHTHKRTFTNFYLHWMATMINHRMNHIVRVIRLHSGCAHIEKSTPETNSKCIFMAPFRFYVNSESFCILSLFICSYCFLSRLLFSFFFLFRSISISHSQMKFVWNFCPIGCSVFVFF